MLSITPLRTVAMDHQRRLGQESYSKSTSFNVVGLSSTYGSPKGSLQADVTLTDWPCPAEDRKA